MSDSKHTSAPWECTQWGDLSDGADSYIVASDAAEVVIARGLFLEDAVLIAASPDMLSAGKDVLAAFDPEAMNPEQFIAWCSLQAAISKAEGHDNA